MGSRYVAVLSAQKQTNLSLEQLGLWERVRNAISAPHRCDTLRHGGWSLTSRGSQLWTTTPGNTTHISTRNGAPSATLFFFFQVDSSKVIENESESRRYCICRNFYWDCYLLYIYSSYSPFVAKRARPKATCVKWEQKKKKKQPRSWTVFIVKKPKVVPSPSRVPGVPAALGDAGGMKQSPRGDILVGSDRGKHPYLRSRHDWGGAPLARQR